MSAKDLRKVRLIFDATQSSYFSDREGRPIPNLASGPGVWDADEPIPPGWEEFILTGQRFLGDSLKADVPIEPAQHVPVDMGYPAYITATVEQFREFERKVIEEVAFSYFRNDAAKKIGLLFRKFYEPPIGSLPTAAGLGEAKAEDERPFPEMRCARTACTHMLKEHVHGPTVREGRCLVPGCLCTAFWEPGHDFESVRPKFVADLQPHDRCARAGCGCQLNKHEFTTGDPPGCHGKGLFVENGGRKRPCCRCTGFLFPGEAPGADQTEKPTQVEPARHPKDPGEPGPVDRQIHKSRCYCGCLFDHHNLDIGECFGRGARIDAGRQYPLCPCGSYRATLPDGEKAQESASAVSGADVAEPARSPGSSRPPPV